jgi:phosphatidate phosphatase APP1
VVNQFSSFHSLDAYEITDFHSDFALNIWSPREQMSATLTSVPSNLPKHFTEDPVKAHRASRLEDAFQGLRARSARARGHQEHVIAFPGFGSTTWVRILSRVLLLRAKKSSSGSVRKVRGWRSFTGVPVAGAIVEVSVAGQVFQVEADRGGVIDQVIPVGLSPGWHTLSLKTETSEAVSCQIFVVSQETTLGVVCDIDDTVMVTALPRPFLAAWNSFVRDEHARRCVPGMPVLLERLVRDNPGAPVIYLSTGAWNVAPTLTRFLRRHLFPPGAFLLTDWGPTHDRWFRSGPEHKRTSLQRLAVEFPDISWVLIGDDGQHDEEIYGNFASHHPTHVRAVAIRELTTPEALFAGGRHHIDRARNPLLVPWVSAPNGAGLAQELGTLGVIQNP